MSILSENLKVLRVSSGLKQAEIAEIVGLNEKTWSSYERAVTEPNIEVLLKMANAFGVIVDTLVSRDVSLIAKSLTGNAHLIRARVTNKMQDESASKPASNPASNQVKESFTHPYSTMPLVVTVDSNNEENVVFVPYKARAGYMAGHSDPKYIATLPTYRIPGLNNGSYRIFELDGHSMVPTFHDRDLLFTKYVESFDQIRDDRVHVVITKNREFAAKRLINRASTDGKLILNSDNQRYPDEYPPIIIDADQVAEIWYGTRFMSSQMRRPGEVYSRLTDLETKVTLLQDRLKKLT
jgi:transcriptional regulator with XRE-family HTH domain